MKNSTPNKNRWNRYLIGIGVVLITLVTTYMVHTHPSLNLADLTNTGVTGALTDVLYMPTYTAGVGESGLIEIKTKQDIASFDSITFALKYNPVNALVFDKNPIIFDVDTVFQDAAFQMTASPEDGKLIVTIILDDPITVTGITPANSATHKTLFKLNTQVSTDLPIGQVVDVTFEDVALLDGPDPLAVPDMPDSTITIASKDELKVLNAESIDSTHILVQFSDLLSDIGNTVAYTITPALNVTLVESGALYGYSQKYVVLTTASQTAGLHYVVTADPLSAIASNEQGSVDVNFSQAPFYGFGSGSDILSSFGMTSASVTGYNTITVNFSDNVKVASVTKTDFALSMQGGGAIAIANVSSVSGKQAVLTVDTPLLKEKTYLLSAVSPNAILRDSDGAGLGVDRTTFNGSKNGPRLISANVLKNGANYSVQFTFDEAIQLGGIANNPVGRLYTTGTTVGTLIDDFNLASYGQSIAGTTLTLTNPAFNAPNTNFTFAVSAPAWLTNSLGVPVEDTYKAISFWGYGHDNAANTMVAPQVTKKDAFKIAPGTLNFNEVLPQDVSVLYDNGGANLVTQSIASVQLVGSNLEVTMSSALDPDRHYIVKIVDDTVNNTTLAVKEFAVTRDLSITSAQAISSTDVRVFFNQNIDERNVDLSDFKVNDGAVVISSMTIDPGYQSVLLKTAGPLSAGTLYKASVSGLTDVYSYDGEAPLLYAAYFSGYQTQSAQSTVKIQSIDVVDSKKIKLHFSGAPDQNSFTPINLTIFRFLNPADPAIRENLTVSGITKIDNTTYELATSVQNPGKNYFVIFNGVKDSSGLQLANSKVFNFFGFQPPAPSVQLVTPNKVTNNLDTNVILSGNNLDMVKEVRLGNKTMTIVTQSKSSLTFSVPANFSADLYTITLIDKANSSFIFKNALLVTVPDQPLTIHSQQSQAIPLNVPNDGVTKAKLWLLVEDPIALADVSSVVVNLTQIGGPSTVEMQKDTGTQPQFSQWYTYETIIPKTVQTKDTPYLLPVEVRKGDLKYNGTISIKVTKDVIKSVAPKIDQAYVSPASAPPDGTLKVKISAQVTDEDGSDTISSVVADLGALGIGFQILKPVSEVTAGTELQTQFFTSDEFTIPTTAKLGTYTINLIASDITGEKATTSVQLQVSDTVNGPVIDKDVSYISPRKSIPRDGKTAFSINAFVSDPDGIADVQTVTANFGVLGLAPVTLKKDPDATAEGKNAWYKAENLIIPTTAPLGTHDVVVMATDKSGAISNLILPIEVTHKDTLGDPPRLVEDRSYTNPRSALNDGQTPITLYAFVQDDDGDVESVIVNLSEIGQVGSQTSGTLGSGVPGSATQPAPASGGNCPTGSNVLVCMNPSVKEGMNGQWFILPGVVINPSTASSPNPYQVDVVVTDAGGKTTSGSIQVYVGAGNDGEEQGPPKALAAIPTSATSLEVLFNKEISASSITASGKGFTIASESDINQELPIISATINPAGNVVTLSTANQDPGKHYVLSLSKSIKDISGRGVAEGAQNRLNFNGFKALNKAPILEYIEATDVTTVELEFRDNLKPSSVRSGMSQTDGSAQFGISIYETEDTSKTLDILGVSLLAPGNIIQIKTGPQKSEQRYRVTLEGLASYDGTALTTPLNKGFKGYNLKLAQHQAAANFADLNNDGRVDFIDFTIFSSVYGTIYSGMGQNVAEAAKKAESQSAAIQQPGQPFPSNPDATSAITSG